MHCPPSSRVLLAFICSSAFASAQNFIDLDFSGNVQATNAWNPNNSTIGPRYFAGLQLDFANVAFSGNSSLGVDARVEVVFEAPNHLISPGYEFVGFVPDYNGQGTENAQGDLGVYYRSSLGNKETVTGGISFKISFFESGSNFSNAKILSDFRFLIYDHDGEPGQSESILAYAEDGLAGYQIRDGSGITTHRTGNNVRFDAGGFGQSETNADGSFIAYYQNTSSVRFDLSATTLSTLPGANNGIFGAFDGDLSIVNGSTNGFGAFVPVPEPSASMLAVGAASLMMLRRKRPLG